MARTYCRRVLGGIIVAFVAGLAPTAVLAKGPERYAPMTIRIVGAGGERGFDASRRTDGEDAAGFIEQVNGSVAVGLGEPAGLPAPGLTDFYEIVLTQGPNATNQLPWYGTPTARFFYYPAGGILPAYVRLHMARVSEPVHDAWLIATPGLTGMVERHLEGLPAIWPRPQPIVRMPNWGWIGFALVLLLGILIPLQRKRGGASGQNRPQSAGGSQP